MSVYTYTTPSTFTIGTSYDTGIVLNVNEYVTRITSISNGQLATHINVETSWASFSMNFVDSNASKSCFLFPVNLETGMQRHPGDIEINAINKTRYTNEQYVSDVNQDLQGAHIYFKVFGELSNDNGYREAVANDYTFSGTVIITVETDFYAPVYVPTATTSVIPSGSGTVSLTSVDDYEKTVTATANTGYKFLQWSCTGGHFADYFSPTTSFYLPEEDATVTAVFTQISSVISAGRYSGATWGKVIPMRYDGTNWVECELQRYNGASWDNVDMQ